MIRFPPLLLSTEDQAPSVETSQTQIVSSIAKDRGENLQAAIENVQDNIQTLMVSNKKWKQLESYPVAERFTDDGKDKREEEEIL